MATYRNNEKAASKRILLQGGLRAIKEARAIEAAAAKKPKKEERVGWRK